MAVKVNTGTGKETIEVESPRDMKQRQLLGYYGLDTGQMGNIMKVFSTYVKKVRNLCEHINM